MAKHKVSGQWVISMNLIKIGWQDLEGCCIHLAMEYMTFKGNMQMTFLRENM